MKFVNIKPRQGHLKKLGKLLADPELAVLGVSYNNTFFSKRYLCRSHLLTKKINVHNGTLETTITTRLEAMGLNEIQITAEVLKKYEAGDIPDFLGDEYGEHASSQDMFPEYISTTQALYSIDLLLKMKAPELTYKDVTIAGEAFTLVDVYEKLDDIFDHTLTFMFGAKGRPDLLAHFSNKDLNLRDAKMILELLVDDNLTGRSIVSVGCETKDLALAVFPYDDPISAYTSASNDGDTEYIFGDGSGYFSFSQESLSGYTMSLFNGKELLLESKTNKIIIGLE
jgi:hypothetical protein